MDVVTTKVHEFIPACFKFLTAMNTKDFQSARFELVGMYRNIEELGKLLDIAMRVELNSDSI